MCFLEAASVGTIFISDVGVTGSETPDIAGGSITTCIVTGSETPDIAGGSRYPHLHFLIQPCLSRFMTGAM
jgi:hypothetical protein